MQAKRICSISWFGPCIYTGGTDTSPCHSNVRISRNRAFLCLDDLEAALLPLSQDQRFFADCELQFMLSSDRCEARECVVEIGFSQPEELLQVSRRLLIPQMQRLKKISELSHQLLPNATKIMLSWWRSSHHEFNVCRLLTWDLLFMASLLVQDREQSYVLLDQDQNIQPNDDSFLWKELQQY